MPEALDLKQLKSELEKQDSPWEMDENTSPASMTENERMRIMGFSPPPGEMSIEEAVKLDASAPPVTAEVIAAESDITAPAAFDHRNVGGKNFTTTVKNQGGCGSCVAHGVLAVMETTYKRANNNAALDIDLSEAHLFYCHGGEEGRNCSNGWFPQAALDKCQSKGVTLESVYPYTGIQQACAVPGNWQSNRAKVSGKTKLNGRAAIKNWIATRGSVTGCFIVYQDFFSYRSGVYRHVSGEQRGGHCMEIVGYSDAEACWICKNSWGSNWGMGGFCKFGYGQCQIETWHGPYGANSVSLRTWANNIRVNGLWTNDAARNAYAHVAGTGWRQLANNNDLVQHTMLTNLIGAKAQNRKVNALIDGKKIVEAYVI